MTQEKQNRIAAAVTVNAVFLIVILAAVAVYQMVVIATARAKYNWLKAEIAAVEQETEDLERDLNDRLKSQLYLEELAGLFPTRRKNILA